MTKIYKDKKMKLGIAKGINTLADTVKTTLGPKGKTVIIKDPFGEITTTKDGVTVAKAIELKDPIQAIGAELVKDIAIKTNTLVGDGTTTATVITQAIFNKGLAITESENDTSQLIKGINQAKNDVLQNIKDKRVIIEGVEDLRLKSIALTSSNNDEMIANTIIDIYEKLGKNAVITAKKSNTTETYYEVIKGMQFDRGFLSPYCVTDEVKMLSELKEGAYILFYDGKLNDYETIQDFLNFTRLKSKPLVVIAEDVAGSALIGLMMNHGKHVAQSAVVLSPGFGKKRVERLHDMAILTDGIVMLPDNKEDHSVEEFLGFAEEIIISPTHTTIIDGKGSKEALNKRVSFLKEKIKFNSGNTYELGILQERLGKLESGVAVINIATYSLQETGEILDRVEDCKSAVKAAITDGIVIGGGNALYKTAKILQRLHTNSPNAFDKGYNALLEAIKEPCKQILINAEYCISKIEDEFNFADDYGFDVTTGEYVDMFQANIVDPYLVIESALNAATSITTLLLNSSHVIISEDDTTIKNFQ